MAKKKETATRSRAHGEFGGWGAGGRRAVPGMRLRRICRGHQAAIGRIAWSPGGRFIASPSQDKTIRIGDANDGKCLALLNTNEKEVLRVVVAVRREIGQTL